jgi:hypothetical protein
MQAPADLADDVRHVLARAELIHGQRRSLSAYQILERLPNREALVAGSRALGLEAFHQAAAAITGAVMSHLADEITFEVANGSEVGLRVGSTTIGSSGPTVVFRIREVGSTPTTGDRF